MRLIDADYITENRVSNDPVVIAAKCAPTIDAIPMDWLDEQIHGYAARLQSTELKALLIVSRLWEKDQEGE